MKSSPFFSVVIPTYNRSSAAKRAVESVLAQSFSDLEVIVVDDGSSDDTRDVVSNIKDNRVRYIFQKNGGAQKARNCGIDAAMGRYVAMLDSDDVFLPHHLDQAYKHLVSAPEDCIYTQVIVDRGDGVQFLKPPHAYNKEFPISDYLLCGRGFVQTSSLVMPKHTAEVIRYDEKLKGGQDTDIAIRLVCAGHCLVMLERPGAIWMDMEDPGRISSKVNPQLREEWLNRIRNFLTKKAFLADRGWPVAKSYARNGNYARAARLYGVALVHGCYKPKMALVVFLQIFLPPKNYRQLSDFLAKFGVSP